MCWVLLAVPIIIFALRRWLKGPKTGSQNSKRLDNKIVVITGGNGGIGQELCLDLARRGAKLYLLCRDVREANKVVDKIVTESPNSPRPEVVELDLTSLESVRICADKVLNKINRIDFLINNAGIILGGKTKTVDGFDMQFGTNHLGHFLLTEMLLPLVKKSAEMGNEPRIIIVTSKGYHHCKAVNWKDLNFESADTFGNLKAYAQSRVANILHSKKLAKDLKEDGVLAFAVHPGILMTNNMEQRMVKHNPLVFSLYYIFLRPVLRFMLKHNKEGSQTILYAVLDDSLKNHSGSYLSDCSIAKTESVANNSADQDLLDKLSRKFVGLEK